LTKAKLQGRAYLQSFGELTQFLTVPKPAETPPETPPPAETNETQVADASGSPEGATPPDASAS
jgi:hypothetical protein